LVDHQPHIFLIGPGGTGKSTLGPRLAADAGATFVDLDLEVCERVATIPELVEDQGYAAYCDANSRIAAQLVDEARGRLVVATSSGFFTHDDQPAVVASNVALVRRAGVAVLVLPTSDLDEAAELISDRQARRWGAEARDYWLAVSRTRLPINRERADVEVVAQGSVATISRAVLAALGVDAKSGLAASAT